MEYGCFSTRIGELCALVSERGVHYLDASDRIEYRRYEWGPLVEALRGEISQYLEGKKNTFSFRPIISGPALRRKVLEEVTFIPCGKTLTYGELAMKTGLRSPRLVGKILSENDILLIIPCHRVVSVKGLGGYKLGVDVKKTLLDLEKKMCEDKYG